MKKVKLPKWFKWGVDIVWSFLDNHCTMHAAGLTYFSLLAVVPVLCVLLFTAKICGADMYARDRVNGYIDEMIVQLEQGQDDQVVKFFSSANIMSNESVEQKRQVALEFGTQARKVSNQLFDRIDKFDIKTLGWIGFLFLLWTVISSIGMVEESFNEIWSVKVPRPIWRRAFMYLALTTVLPIFTAAILSMPVMGVVKTVLEATFGATVLTKWFSDSLIWFLESPIFKGLFVLTMSTISFGFFFWVMPNCNVPKRHALIGGLMTAIMLGSWMKLCAVAQVGIAKSSALYGSFAFVPIVLAWCYMSWQIILLGATIVRALGKWKTMK